MFTDPALLKTARGIARPDLDRLDAAHRTLIDFEEQIINRLRERSVPAPQHVIDIVESAIADLISEDVN